MRIRFVGRRDRISERLLERIEWAEQLTAGHTRRGLFVAFDYGGRDEILEAAARYSGGGEEEFRRGLYEPELRTPSWLSGPAASSGSPISCSGNPRTRSCTFRTGCGPTSIARSWSARWTTTRHGSEGSEPASGQAAGSPLVPPQRTRPQGARSAAPRRRRGRRPVGGSTAARVVIALPWIAFAVAIVVAGGWVFALALVGLGLAGLHELYRMLAPVRPVALAGFLAVSALILAAHLGDQFQMVLVLAASVVVTFVLAIARPYRRHVTLAIAATLLGVLWVGLPLAHTVLLRDLDHGEGLLVDVLIATFLGDTGAYFGGRLWGTRPLAPRISPAKTVEGLVAGVFVGTFSFWFAGLYQDWLSGIDALVIGACVAAVAPLGDLFESLIKRDLGVKDTGTLFGEHGGVLDRLDAAFFTIVMGYYVSLALL